MGLLLHLESKKKMRVKGIRGPARSLRDWLRTEGTKKEPRSALSI